MAPDLDPDVIGEVEDVAGVESEGAAVGSEEIGKFSAAAAAGLEEGAGRVVAGECGFGFAQLAFVD